jgi:catechol 2,3-dioxygenase-like lactoylglutathione lyase family enzyme
VEVRPQGRRAVRLKVRTQLRIARPVSSLERSVALYTRGLGLSEIGGFRDHEGFDGVMLGKPELDCHFEFTYCRAHPVTPAPTPEDLIVLYLPDSDEWRRTCASMLEAGFCEVPSFNPYWRGRGRTFEDHDRYRVVLQQEEWSGRASD